MSADTRLGTDLFGDPIRQPERLCMVNDGRADQVGPHAWSDLEVLAGMLGGGSAALTISERLIGRGETLCSLAKWRLADWTGEPGIGEAVAYRLIAGFEAGRRVQAGPLGEAPLLTRADLVAAYMAPAVGVLDVEKFWVLCLNRKNRLMKRVEITTGTATAALAHPREVFRAAIRESAAALICVHNHPSGDPAPSAADLQITHMLREAAKTVEITLLDHVILGRAGADPLGRGYYSFRDAGLM